MTTRSTLFTPVSMVVCCLGLIFSNGAFAANLAVPLPLATGQKTEILPTASFYMENLGAYKRSLALKVLPVVMSPEGIAVVRSMILPNGESLSLHTLLRQIELRQPGQTIREARQYVRDLDDAIRRAKGLDRFTSELLEIRLEPPITLGAFLDGAEPLLTYVPGGDEQTWTSIEAFDSVGRAIELDPNTAPNVPVLVVGINEKEDLRAGMAALQALLSAAEVARGGVQVSESATPSATDYFHKLTWVYLKDDKEPWTSGSAEVYALPSGVDPAKTEAEVAAVDMPYLDNSETVYQPNQLVIGWKYYRYSAANLHLYEHDDSTSLQTIVTTLISAIGYVYPEYAAIASVGAEIVALMPADWYANDDDYVDVYYTLEKAKNYSNYYGASGNAKISISLYSLTY